MPELPEVEAHARRLRRWTRGRAWAGAVVLDPTVVRPSVSPDPRTGGGLALPPWVGPCGPVLRRGKRLGLTVDDSGGGLIVHLGMTGHLVRTSGSIPRFARAGFHLDDGSVVWLADARRFGCVVPVGSLAAALSDGLGPEADAFADGRSLAARFGRVRGPIKPALLDQARLAGLGNIHAGEALWRVGVHPLSPVPAVPPAAWQALAVGLPEWLERAVEMEGDVGSDEPFRYVSEGGANPFAVYDREGEPCPRCGASIDRLVVAGRSTFVCPACQPPPCRSPDVS